jgi:hypothetical protein
MQIKTRPRHSGKRFLLIRNPVVSDSDWVPDTGYRIESGMTVLHHSPALLSCITARHHSPALLSCMTVRHDEHDKQETCKSKQDRVIPESVFCLFGIQWFQTLIGYRIPDTGYRIPDRVRHDGPALLSGITVRHYCPA